MLRRTPTPISRSKGVAGNLATPPILPVPCGRAGSSGYRSSVRSARPIRDTPAIPSGRARRLVVARSFWPSSSDVSLRIKEGTQLRTIAGRDRVWPGNVLLTTPVLRSLGSMPRRGARKRVLDVWSCSLRSGRPMMIVDRRECPGAKRVRPMAYATIGAMESFIESLKARQVDLGNDGASCRRRYSRPGCVQDGEGSTTRGSEPTSQCRNFGIICRTHRPSFP